MALPEGFEGTLGRKDHDFAELFVAYSLVRAECVRLKEAVLWERECRDVFSWLNNVMANIHADLEAHRSLIAARRAVEDLL